MLEHHGLYRGRCPFQIHTLICVEVGHVNRCFQLQCSVIRICCRPFRTFSCEVSQCFRACLHGMLKVLEEVLVVLVHSFSDAYCMFDDHHFSRLSPRLNELRFIHTHPVWGCFAPGLSHIPGKPIAATALQSNFVNSISSLTDHGASGHRFDTTRVDGVPSCVNDDSLPRLESPAVAYSLGTIVSFATVMVDSTPNHVYCSLA